MTLISSANPGSQSAQLSGREPYLQPDATAAFLSATPDVMVTIIVVAYHGARWIPACLESLAGASRERLRLVLVDNSGNDGCIPQLHPAFEYVVLQTPRPLGFAEANNFALQHHAADGAAAVCFLNQDTRSDSGWIDECFACLRARPDVGAVTPLLRTYDRADWDAAFLDCARKSPTWSAGSSSSEEFHAVPRITAAAMLVRASALWQVGPFDPVFGSYYEDYDLCYRLRRAGYRVGFCERATVCHFSGASTTTDAAVRKRMRQILRNRAILEFREASGRRAPAIARFLTATLPRNMARAVLRTPSSQPLKVQCAAYWDLLKQWRRLISPTYDEKVWQKYLGSIGWPNSYSRESQDARRV